MGGHRWGERIERAVTINAVIAWRLKAMTQLDKKRRERDGHGRILFRRVPD